MKYFALLALATLGSAMKLAGGKADDRKMGGAMACKNGTAHVLSTKAQCFEMEKAQHLVSLVGNETLLTKVTHGNATKAAEVQSRASSAAAAVQSMQANATLMAACSQIQAAQAMDKSCAEMAGMEKLAALAANQTALTHVTKGNATRASALQAKSSSDAASLQALQSNTTLTAYCSTLQTKAECSAMARLQKEVDMAKNTTWLDTKFCGNTTKVQEFKAKVTALTSQLATMRGNSTLMNICSQQKSTSLIHAHT